MNSASHFEPSTSSELKLDAEKDRCKDYLYRMLVSSDTDESERLYSGIYAILQQTTQHPCRDVVIRHSTKDPLMRKALLLLALNHDSSIRQHMIDHRGTCGDTISQFIHDYLPHHVQSFLEGKASLDYFVSSAVVDYVTI